MSKGPSLAELCAAARARPLNRTVLRLDARGRKLAERHILQGIVGGQFVECQPFDFDRWWSEK